MCYTIGQILMIPEGGRAHLPCDVGNGVSTPLKVAVSICHRLINVSKPTYTIYTGATSHIDCAKVNGALQPTSCAALAVRKYRIGGLVGPQGPTAGLG